MFENVILSKWVWIKENNNNEDYYDVQLEKKTARHFNFIVLEGLNKNTFKLTHKLQACIKNGVWIRKLLYEQSFYLVKPMKNKILQP